MSTRQKIILTTYAILGLPGLPLACLFWLSNRYNFGMRNQTKEDFLSFMMAMSLLEGIIVGIVYLTR